MKKLLFIAALFAVTISYGQVNFGIKAGTNFYNFTGKDVKTESLNQSRSLKPGLVAGGFAEFSLSKLISIQPSLLYSQEGNFQKEGSNKAIFKFNYLNLPVVIKYNDASGFFGETGPQVGYLLNARSKFTDGTNTEETSISSDNTKSIAFAWTVGAGWKFKNGLGINARSQWALTSALTDEKIGNSGFYASVFYVFKCSHAAKK